MRVLVVEDEKKVAALVKGGLAEHGIAAEVCHHGDEALQRASSETFDGLVLDIMLPGRDGLSILRKLRAEGHNVPVVLLTARGDVEERVEGLNLGADDYLAKPFAIAELVARLRAVWRRAGGRDVQRAGVCGCGDESGDARGAARREGAQADAAGIFGVGVSVAGGGKGGDTHGAEPAGVGLSVRPGHECRGCGRAEVAGKIGGRIFVGTHPDGAGRGVLS